jgi:hypothetical protein
MERTGPERSKAMESGSTWIKTSMIAAVALGFAVTPAAFFPSEASARASRNDIRVKVAINTRPSPLGVSARRGSAGKESRYHRPSRNRLYRHSRPRPGRVKHAPPPRRVIVAPVRRPRASFTTLFIYNFRPEPYRRPEPAPIYRVVQTNASTAAPASGYWISVTADLLNVRSGPDLSKPVVQTVNGGDTLNVEGTAPGWLYVSLPGGRAGWVMERYTVPLSKAPTG